MKKQLLVLIVFTIAILNNGISQNQVTGPIKVSKAVGFNVSKELRDMKPIPPGQRQRTWKNKLVPNKFGIEDELKNMAPLNGPDQALQNTNGSRDMGSILQNFPGNDNQYGVAPPDTDGDVGLNHFFQMVNQGFSIWDKEGNLLYGPVDNITLWDDFIGPWSSTNDGDPVIMYDEYADRWIATQFSLPYGSGTGPYYELVAVSQTGDPLGAWNRYAFQFSAMPDYPKFGVWPDGYYMSTHRFSNGSWAGAGMTVMDREAMLAGSPDATMIEFTVGSNYYGVLAADADGATPPPAGSPNYLLDVGENQLRLWECSVDWDNTANSSLSSLGSLTTLPFSNNGLSISQPGTGQKLDALANMTMYRLQYRNFNDYQVMLANHTVNGGGGKAGIRWYELRNYGSGWSIYQQGTFSPADGQNRWMGSIAMNQNGDIALGYSVSSTTTYPSIRVAGQSAGAPLGLGVFDIEETSILEGTNSQTGVNRWGDYSCMTVDPSDAQSFWYTTEYSNGGWNWATQIASFGFVQVPVADFISDEIIIPVGETVNFTDKTTGIPSEWTWTFEGGTPATSSDQNPQDILYDTEGTFAVTLTSTNYLGTDTVIKEAYITASTTILPEVDFTSNRSQICVGDTVQFTDQSIYSPIQWEWSFTPADVTFIEGTDQNSQNPVVVFNDSYSYSATLTAWNLNGSSSITKDDAIMAGGLRPYFKETFEDGAYYSQNWLTENPDDEMTWERMEVGGSAPGNMAAVINLREYFSIGQRDRLISPIFNLESMNNAALGFMHAYAKRYEQVADSLIVMVSGDCGQSWTRVFADAENGSGNFATHELVDDFWPTTITDWCLAGWGASCNDIDISQWAGQPNVRVAFESFSFQGNPLFIDNMTISQFVGQEESLVDASDVKVYPNPSTGTFHIVLPKDHSFADVQMVNQMGQTVLQQTIVPGSNSVEIQSEQKLNAGLYFLKISNKSQRISKKVLVY